MDNTTGQFGAGGSAPENEGQGKMNPMSPNFMGSDNSASDLSATPTNPPMGGSPVPPPPPLPPVPPTPIQNQASPSPVPPPPPKEVNIRTMDSDQASLRASGGMESTPTTIKPPASIDGDVKKVDSAGGPSRIKASGNKKALLIGLGIVVLLGTSAFVVIQFVLPIFFGDGNRALETEEVVLPEEGFMPTPTVPTFVHKSHFSSPLGTETELIVREKNPIGVRESLVPVALGLLGGEENLNEFYVVGDSAGTPMIAKDFLGVLLPDTIMAISLESDFTGFLYSDGENVWPGYVFALDVGNSDLDVLKKILGEELESSSVLSNFFIEDPGEPSIDGFKDGNNQGELRGIRYLSYENGGSINYGWKENKIVISSSYAGFGAVSEMIRNLADENASPPVVVDEEPEEELDLSE